MDNRSTAAPAVAVPPSGVEAFGYRQELKRSLGLFDLLIYGLVFIVPTAPFPVFGIVFNASKGMVPLVYAVGLVAMVFTAWSYMTMSLAFPVAGSVYTYASRSLGEVAGFFAGWGILLDYLLTPTLIYVVCAIAVHTVVPGIPKGVWVVLLLSFSTMVNFFGIETATRINIALLALQLVLLAVFLVLAVIALMHGVAGAHLSITPLYNSKLITPHIIFGALSLAVLSFLGFDAVSTLAEETVGGPHLVGSQMSQGIAVQLGTARHGVAEGEFPALPCPVIRMPVIIHQIRKHRPGLRLKHAGPLAAIDVAEAGERSFNRHDTHGNAGIMRGHPSLDVEPLQTGSLHQVMRWIDPILLCGVGELGL